MDCLETLAGRGFTLGLEGGKLMVSPASKLTDGDREFIRRHRADLVERVAALVCPACRRPADARGRCWQCCERVCEKCRKATGSAFIALCCECGNR